MTTRQKILYDFEATLQKLFNGKVKKIRRGLVPLESVKATDMPLICYNAAATMSQNHLGQAYSRNTLSMNLGFTLIDREGSDSRYYSRIDEYVELIQRGLDEYEQFSDNILKADFTIEETVNDNFLDGFIVINVSMNVIYYEER